jgi:dUTP pyrophosphatase
MKSLNVKISLKKGAVLPARMSEGASGFDLCAFLECEIEILPGNRFAIPTGIHLAIPAGFEGQIRSRSGLAIRHGLMTLNSPGTIDSDYRGEIKVILCNLGTEPVKISPGDRIAQIVFCPISIPQLTVVDEIDETPRGTGGFGSTGK